MKGNATLKKRAAPWAIRGVPLEARNAAMSAARREGVTLGAWLDRAIRQQIKAGRGQEVGLMLEDALVKLVESMGQQATTNVAILARLEAVERVSDRRGRAGGGAALMRLYGLLRGRQRESSQVP